MPVYKYKFEDGLAVEVFQNMSDDPHEELIHPVTGLSERVKRVPSWGTDPVFIGSGFYRNDK